jgi:hypothetical protein
MSWYIEISTLICWKPAFSRRSLADFTAWKAIYSQYIIYRRHLSNIRVGEALTNERKSSAALRDGLVAMARFIYDSANGDADTNRDDIVV